MKRIKLLFLILVFAREAGGAELFEYNIPIRARGMGGVYTPFPAATDAVLVNPAYLPYVDEMGWELFNIDIGVNGLSAYNDFQNIGNGLDGMFGKRLWLLGAGRSNLVLPYLGLSYFNESRMNLAVNNPMFPSLDMEFYNDAGYQFGFGIPIGPIFSFGLGIKQIRRWGGAESFGVATVAGGVSDVSSLLGDFHNIGTGYGLDPAIMAKFPGPLSPSLSFVWKDIGSTQFTLESGADSPKRIKDNLIFGAGMLLDVTGLDVRAGMEYRHIHTTGEPIGKKLHFGTEVSLPFVDVRAGLSQGYQSYGLGLDLFLFRFDAAMYSVERGAYPGQLKDDRIEAAISMQFAIDADFGFTSKDSRTGATKKRRLKQRR